MGNTHHGVCVLLQFLSGDGLPVLEEQVLKEALKGHTRLYNCWMEVVNF